MSYFDWHPYVPVAKKRRQAERELAQLRKRGQSVAPVTIEGRSSGSGGKIVTYDKSLYDATQHGEWLAPTVSSLAAWHGGFTVNLPPWSVVAVQIN